MPKAASRAFSEIWASRYQLWPWRKSKPAVSAQGGNVRSVNGRVVASEIFELVGQNRVVLAHSRAQRVLRINKDLDDFALGLLLSWS